MFAIYSFTKNYISKNVLSELILSYFITAQAGFYILEVRLTFYRIVGQLLLSIIEILKLNLRSLFSQM